MSQPNRVAGIHAKLTGVDGDRHTPLAPQGSVNNEFLPPIVDWDVFREEFEWDQGEHVACIGPTGAGKTTLALFLLDYRKFVTVFATKPVDETLDALQRDGFVRHTTWEKFRPPQFEPRRLLWPNARKLNAATQQSIEFSKAFEAIYIEGKWCLFIDELWFMINQLKFQQTIKTYLMQARSLKISLVCLTQRPSGVPVELYDQSTHLFFWRDNDSRNLDRLAGISWADGDLVRYAIATLDKYQVLYVNTRKGLNSMMRFTPPPLEEKET